jgi:hypothetical protein
MPARNHELTFRPLQGGIEIINPANDRPGTLGAILKDATERYTLSCYHVLCRPAGAPFVDGEPILQSIGSRGGSPIGKIFSANVSAALDCAAARITPGIESAGRVLGLGPLGPPLAASVGMRVLKSGYYSGITEGVVLRVQNDRVEIGRPAGYPGTYELSDFGDSGAIWIERDSGSPVAMHTGTSPAANAQGLSILAVLGALGLELVIGP